MGVEVDAEHAVRAALRARSTILLDESHKKPERNLSRSSSLSDGPHAGDADALRANVSGALTGGRDEDPVVEAALCLAEEFLLPASGAEEVTADILRALLPDAAPLSFSTRHPHGHSHSGETSAHH